MARSSSDFDKHAREMINAQPVPPGVRQSAWWLYLHEKSKVKPTPYTLENVLAGVLLWINEQRLLIETLKMSPSPAQRRRLQMLADGMSQKQIAHALGESVNSTRVYFWRMRAQLGFESLYHLVAIAVQKGWVKPKPGKEDRPRKRG